MIGYILSRCSLICLIFICSLHVHGQELFPANEPASTIPKGGSAIRFSTLVHTKKSWHREMIRAYYGVSANLTMSASIIGSNFHFEQFPSDLNAYYRVYHNHQSSAAYYPYKVEGFDIYAKYRVLTRDGRNRHFRVALVGEAAYSNATHLDAFPMLTGDNSGLSGGFIATQLIRRTALSVTSTITNFFAYSRWDGTQEVQFRPGTSIDVNTSVGHLLYPKSYTSYRNLNINLYGELQAKFYQTATLTRGGTPVNTEQFKYLKGGSLLFVCPAVQFIIHSKMRIDVGGQIPIHYTANPYGLIRINVQRYFF